MNQHNRRFVAYFYFVGWSHYSLGVHFCASLPNFEIHVPFGFFRVGLVKHYHVRPLNADDCDRRCFGVGR